MARCGRERCGRRWLQVLVKASRRAWAGRGWRAGGLGGEPVLEGLPEPLDLALGLRVARLAVLLLDAEAAQFVLEAVAAAAAAGESGGEHQPVVRQGGGRDPVLSDRGAELRDDGGAADAAVRGDAQQVAGMVIEPGQDPVSARRPAGSA